jgi:hypothetical protein
MTLTGKSRVGNCLVFGVNPQATPSGERRTRVKTLTSEEVLSSLANGKKITRSGWHNQPNYMYWDADLKILVSNQGDTDDAALDLIYNLMFLQGDPWLLYDEEPTPQPQFDEEKPVYVEGMSLHFYHERMHAYLQNQIDELREQLRGLGAP